MHLNQLTVIGFTGTEADVHYTTNGTLVTTLSVATKESWKNADGEWQSRTEWHRVVLFAKLAEYGRTLAKGSHVMVQALCGLGSMRRMGSVTGYSSSALTLSASWTELSVETPARLRRT